MADRVLIKGGTVLSLDRAVGNMVEADVLIEDGIISEVGPSLRARGAEVVDAADTIVMPGFVDAHRHLWQSLAGDAGQRPTPTCPADYTPDDVYAATLVGLLRALEAGITTVVDWCDISGDAAHLEAALPAHADSGVRTVFVPSASSARRRSADTTVACGSPDVVEAELDAVARRAGRRPATAGRRIHAHAGTAAAAGGEVAELGRRGLLGPDVTLCALHPPERRRLRRHRGVVDRGGAHPGERHGRRRGPASRCSSSSIAASGRAWASATSSSPPAMSSPRCGPSSPCSTPRCSTSSWRAREASPTCSGPATSSATPPSTVRGSPGSRPSPAR